jgi:hypothetical protein
MLKLTQPLVWKDGQVRFKPNPLVRLLLNGARSLDLNMLWEIGKTTGVPIEDFAQFYQLIGYSVGGFSEVFQEELPGLCDEAEQEADRMIAAKENTG